MSLARIYLASPTMTGDEMKFIEDAFRTNWIAPMGPNVDAFEDELAAYVGVPYAVALISGTAAIHMALKAAGVRKGDTVFCSSLTFAASCNPIIYRGAVPVFIDCEPGSWNMSPAALEKAFEKHPHPRAVIVVHLYGQSADMDRILEICGRHDVPVIEDAAESLGATYKGKKTGSLSQFGVYSFNGNKIITTSGGGMLVSEDKDVIEKVRFWATQARDPAPYYQHSELGYNYRLSNVLAGIGRGQLMAIEERLGQKKKIYETYCRGFENIGTVKMNPVRDYGVPNYWLSCITIDAESSVRPADVIAALECENIEARHIWKPMHLQPYYDQNDFFNHNDNGTSVSQDIFERGLCLPSDVKMTDEDMARVIDAVKNCFQGK